MVGEVNDEPKEYRTCTTINGCDRIREFLLPPFVLRRIC